MMKMKLYQINLSRDADNLAFFGYEFVTRRTKTDHIRTDIYDCVFKGEVDCESLEDAYHLFNVDHPKDYRGRSMSISDVVEVMESDCVPKGMYYCDTIGFKEVLFDRSKEEKTLPRKKTAVREDREEER